MVEIEELPDNSGTKPTTDAAGASAGASAGAGTAQKKKRMLRKDFPPIGQMLANGSPESQGRPKTFCDVFGYPIFIAVCFALSLLAFHYAPHDKSVQPRGKFSMKNMQKQQRQVPVPPPTVGAQDDHTSNRVHDSPPLEKINDDGEL